MTSVSHVITYMWIMDISYMWSSMTRRVKRHQVPSPVTMVISVFLSRKCSPPCALTLNLMFVEYVFPYPHSRNRCLVETSKSLTCDPHIYVINTSTQWYHLYWCITSISSQVTVKIMKETEKIWVGKYISQCKYPYNIICVEDALLCSPGSTHRREYQTRGSPWISLTVTRRD
jgi:hypothetical protein